MSTLILKHNITLHSYLVNLYYMCTEYNILMCLGYFGSTPMANMGSLLFFADRIRSKYVSNDGFSMKGL